MTETKTPFFRHYRAALFDYLVGNGESGLAYAYELGRSRIDEGTGLLQVLRVHQEAVNSILRSTQPEKRLRRLKASEEFLMEALSPFEMASRGYAALINADRHGRPPEESVPHTAHRRL